MVPTSGMTETMPRKSRYDAELVHLSGISNGLVRVAEELRGRDVELIQGALDALEDFKKITEDLKTLTDELLEIENTHGSETAEFPDQVAKVDLAACILAMTAINKFFHLRAVSRNLQMLRDALLDVKRLPNLTPYRRPILTPDVF